MRGAAARLNDPIEHSSALDGLLAGLAIGAGTVLIGIAVVGTGGLGTILLGAMVGAGSATGAGIGQLIGGLSFASSEAGAICSGSSNVFINGRPAARAHRDVVDCLKHPGTHKRIAQGSKSVYINGQPAARVGDRTVCDAKISAGSNNVVIGGDTKTTDEIDPEIPIILERTLMGLGLASAMVLASPVIVIASLTAGIAAGAAGHWVGGKVFGDGSDGQKLMAFGAGLIGGGLGAKGGKAFDARYEIQIHGLGSNLGNIKVVPRNSDSVYHGTLRGRPIELPGVKTEKLTYVKRSRTELVELRKKFNSTERKSYLNHLSNSRDKVSTLKAAGFSESEIANMQSGKLPSREWQVHHIKPLDDGGTNAFENLTLIRNDPYHTAITNAQNSMTRGMKPGDVRTLDWPMIDVDIYPPSPGLR